jgi:cytochrome P450
MSAIYLLPDLSLEDAVRRMHPFPILERYVDCDIVHNNVVVVRAHTQVMMFVSDFQRYQYQWNIFGGGSRVCAGTHIALPVLRLMKAGLASLPNFKPVVKHRYSGRNNDVSMSFPELVYYLSMVYNFMLQPGKSG